ncbi:hypothetical protein OAG75_00395 [bacterium]|nr:hypothetical protein [bacterium]
MLTIYIPLPEGHRYPNDKDAWYLESLAELVDETLHSLGATIGGFETGPNEVGLCVFDADPKAIMEALTPLLKRHCPLGTYLHTFYDEDEGEEGESEDIGLFIDSDTPSCEPLPLSSPKFVYSPLDSEPFDRSVEFATCDRHIFKAIASSPGITVKDLNNMIDYFERIRLNDDKLSDGVTRLLDAGYIYLDSGGLYVTQRIAPKLPLTAKGNISTYRDDAWEQFNNDLFGSSR